MMKEAISAVETRPMAVTHTHTAVRAIALLLVCVVMTGLTATAQVEWKDRYVTLASGDQKNPSIAQPPGTGYTVIVWEDYRSGSSDIYAQRIENGNGIATWFPIDGVPVCTAEGEQRNPRAAFDGDGNVIICWEDYRNDLSTPFDPLQNIPEVWATRILLDDGTEDPTWLGGRLIDGNQLYRSYRPRIAGTIDGAFITWTTTRDVGVDVYIQYMLASTASWPTGGNWVANGIRVNASADYEAQNSEIVVDSIYAAPNWRCGAVVAYEGRVSHGSWQISMDRINSAGSRVWGDYIIAPTGYEQTNVKIAHAGEQQYLAGTSKMVVAVWEDGRNMLTTDVDVYAQMVKIINPQSQWPNTSYSYGLQISNANDLQMNPDLVVKNSYAVIAWEDMQDYINTGLDIYANEVDLNTQVLTNPGGVDVCKATGNQQHICLSRNAELNTVWIGWEDWRSGVDIYYQKYSWATFNNLLIQDGWPVTVAKEDQTEPVLGAGVFVYTDARRQPIPNDNQHDLNIYAQQPGDECDAPTGMHWKDELAEWTLNSEATDKRFAVDNDGNTYVVWFEMRVMDQSGDGVPGIYAQKLDKDGVPRWQNDGVLLSEDADCGTPDVVAYTSDGSGVFVWRELAGIRVARVDAYGSISWRSSCLCQSGNCSIPCVTATGNDIYVAFSDYVNGIATEVFDGNGNSSGWFTASAASLHTAVKICSDMMSGCYVASLNSATSDLEPAYIYGAACYFGLPIASNVTSFDLAVDRVPWNQSQPGAGIFAYTTANAAYVQKIQDINVSIPIPRLQSAALIASGGGTYSSICVASDSVESPYSDIGGGAIVAWDHHEYVAGLGAWSHIVQTQRVSWQQYGLGLTMQWASPLNLISYTYRQASETFPDIVWKWNPNSENIYGIVAWQDVRTPWCPSGDAAIAQCVNYAEPNLAQAILWATDGEAMSPQLGGTMQTAIQLERCPDASGVAMVSGYWLDKRAGGNIIAGTKIDDVISGSSHAFVIRKENSGGIPEARVSSLQLAQNYPNPAVHGGTTIGFTLPSDGQCTIRLYDTMGRIVSVLVSGWYNAGSYSCEVAGSVLARLPSGVYRYEITSGGNSVSRMMMVVN